MNIRQNRLWKFSRTVARYVGQRVNVETPCFNRPQSHLHSTATSRYVEPVREGEGVGIDHSGSFTHPAAYRLEDIQDIYINDLDATLEAHRAANKAKIIRRVKASTDPTVKHLILPKPVDDANLTIPQSNRNTTKSDGRREKGNYAAGKATVKVNDSLLKPWEYWPVGSIQRRERFPAEQVARKGAVLEYHARAMNPVGLWKRPSTRASRSDFFRPWLGHLDETGGDALQRLGNEIIAFERYIAPSDAEMMAMRKIVSQVKAVVSSRLTTSSCEVVGSYSTGLALAYSDIDFAVSLPDVEKEAATHRKSRRGIQYQKIYRRILLRLQEAFAVDGNFRDNSATIVYARIPIVQVTHRRTNQKIQLQVSTDCHQQRQYILAYLAEYPTLRPLYFVIRSCLEMRRLSITFEGGLGSYAILMLIVNALKHASGRFNNHDVGSQLLHVLDFYTNSNLYKYGFSVDPPHMFLKGGKSKTDEEGSAQAADPMLRGIDLIAKSNPQQPYLLCLQDPSDPTNDLGRKAYAIKHIQETFASAKKTIGREMEAWDRRSDATSAEIAAIGLLDPLIHGNYRSFTFDRRKIEEYGSSMSSEAEGNRVNRKLSRFASDRHKISAREMLEKVKEVDQRKAAERAE